MIKKYIWIYLGVCFITLLSGTVAYSQNKTLVDIDIRPESIVSKTFYTLGDIANISSANKPLTDELGNLKFGMSPLPGMSYKISSASVLSRLRMYNAVSTIRLNVPDNAIVSRKSLRIPVSRIENILLSELQKKSLPVGTNYKPVTPIKDVILPDGKFSYRISEGKLGGKIPIISYRIDYLINENVEKTMNYTFRTNSLNNTSAHNNQIRNTPKTNNYNPNRETVSSNNTNIPTNVRSSGMVISRGKQIRIVFNSGAINLVVKGIASESGNVGDIISVVNIDSKRTVTGRVVDSSTVVAL